ncbi:MAG: hypothetical protein RL129_330 [Actinomycetota bacterium]|jgi:hypothetical protein
MAQFKLNNRLTDEDGSISMLLIFLFIISTLVSLIVVDIADAYLAKRQLSQIGEAAANMASHQIDLNRYYERGLIDNGLGYKQVPLDCMAAIEKARNYIYSNSLRGNPISLISGSCVNENIYLRLSSEIRPLVMLPIVSSSIGQKFPINAQVIATSVVR